MITPVYISIIAVVNDIKAVVHPRTTLAAVLLFVGGVCERVRVCVYVFVHILFDA